MTSENCSVICDLHTIYDFLQQQSIYFPNKCTFLSYIIYVIVEKSPKLEVEKKCNSKSAVLGPISDFEM